jgi:hypothetical protein
MLVFFLTALLSPAGDCDIQWVTFRSLDCVNTETLLAYYLNNLAWAADRQSASARFVVGR